MKFFNLVNFHRFLLFLQQHTKVVKFSTNNFNFLIYIFATSIFLILKPLKPHKQKQNLKHILKICLHIAKTYKQSEYRM